MVEFEKDANQALEEFFRDLVRILDMDVFIDKALVLVVFMASPPSFNFLTFPIITITGPSTSQQRKRNDFL